MSPNIVVKKEYGSSGEAIGSKVVTSGGSTGTIRVNSTSGGFGRTSVNQMADVDVSGLVNQSILLWDSTANKWKSTQWDSMEIDGGQIV